MTVAAFGEAVEKRERNERVKSRYDELMAEGKHGHYETMFRVVREEVERAAKQWQRIEKAPKDGTSVLIYSTEWGDDAKPALAHWSNIYGRWVPLDRQIADDVCRHMSESNFDFCTEMHEEPTHWMPLPEPPLANGQFRKDVEK